ncbi:MAG: permease-like cell division protein FtsX [Bacteroidales bacterium]|nr:permease-like cell division protein FtsX [Bacteroidales bacterium]
MVKKEKNIIARRLVHSYLSSIISISMVLLLVGLFAILAVNAKSVSDYFKENVKISVILKEEVEDLDAREVEKHIGGLNSVKSTEYISKEQGTREMKDLLGEDFLKVFDVNPIPISIDVLLNADYFEPDSLEAFKLQMSSLPQVDEVLYQNTLIEAINDNIERIGLVLMVFIALLLFISFVLINNTVRLNVYSKRFSIYTMRLVGATKAFIRAPFLLRSMFQGLISALIAVLILLGVLFVVKEQFAQLFNVFEPKLLVAVMSGIVLLGILICVVCTFFVVNKLVSLTNDELYY